MADECANSAFLLVTPDALVRHLGRAIVDRLLDAGFRVVAYRVNWKAPPLLHRFHARNRAVVADSGLHALVEELFTLGPSLALLLTDGVGAGDGSESIHDRLGRLKGLGDPLLAQRGSLRHDLGAINTILNLVHTADSPKETQHDADIFLGSVARYTPSAIGTLVATLESIEKRLPLETRTFTDVLDSVQARLSGSAKLDAAFQGGALSAAQAADVMASLEQRNVRLDRWERIVIATSLRFPPVRAIANCQAIT